MKYNHILLTLAFFLVSLGVKAQSCPPAVNEFSTPYAANNGWTGVMFDVIAINNIEVTCFDVNVEGGFTRDFEIYTRPGTHVGFEDNAAGWTLLGTVAGIPSAGTDNQTTIPIPFSVQIAAGQTTAFYITATAGTFRQAIIYTTAPGGTAPGDVFSSNADLEVTVGTGKGYPFGTNFRPRFPNVTVRYGSANVQIDTANVNTEFFCQGSPILDIPFTFSGDFEADNEFTVELADASGSFANPVASAIGTSSPLRLVLSGQRDPSFIYRVRVLSSNPVVESEIFEFTCPPLPERPPYTPVLSGEANYSFVDLEWTLPPAGVDVEQYEVYLGMRDEIPNTLLALTKENDLRVDLINGINYSFFVRPLYIDFGSNGYVVGDSSNIVTLKPSIVLGNENIGNSQFSIYPNPSEGNFTLQFIDLSAKEATIRVTDLTGKTVFVEKIREIATKNSYSTSLPDQASGMYIISMETEKGIYQQKISVIK